MSTIAVKKEPIAMDVSFKKDSLCVSLVDGREVCVPLEWFPRLREASDVQRKDWRLIGGGIGIHWEAVDEDISIESLLSNS